METISGLFSGEIFQFPMYSILFTYILAFPELDSITSILEFVQETKIKVIKNGQIHFKKDRLFLLFIFGNTGLVDDASRYEKRYSF